MLNLDKIENLTKNQIYYFKSPVAISNTGKDFEEYYIIGDNSDSIKLNGKEINLEKESNTPDKYHICALGLLHREDGPAILCKFCDHQQWFHNDIPLSDEKQRLLNHWMPSPNPKINNCPCRKFHFYQRIGRTIINPRCIQQVMQIVKNTDNTDQELEMHLF